MLSRIYYENWPISVCENTLQSECHWQNRMCTNELIFLFIHEMFFQWNNMLIMNKHFFSAEYGYGMQPRISTLTRRNDALFSICTQCSQLNETPTSFTHMWMNSFPCHYIINCISFASDNSKTFTTTIRWKFLWLFCGIENTNFNFICINLYETCVVRKYH